MMVISMISGAVSAILGYWLAHILDASIAGSIMAVMGILFLLTYLFSPLEGRLTKKIRHNNQREEISLLTLLIHLQSHDDKQERSIHHLQEHINWTTEKSNRILNLAQKKDFIQLKRGVILITENGQNYAKNKVKGYLEK